MNLGTENVKIWDSWEVTSSAGFKYAYHYNDCPRKLAIKYEI